MYTPAKERYETMEYNRCGESGLMLPKVSLGLWHNFGDTSDYENMKRGCRTNVRQLILYSTQNAGLRKARRLWYN